MVQNLPNDTSRLFLNGEIFVGPKNTDIFSRSKKISRKKVFFRKLFFVKKLINSAEKVFPPLSRFFTMLRFQQKCWTTAEKVERQAPTFDEGSQTIVSG